MENFLKEISIPTINEKLNKIKEENEKTKLDLLSMKQSLHNEIANLNTSVEKIDLLLKELT